MGNRKKIESEISFKELIKNPLRLFGLVYIYFIVIGLILGIYFIKNMDRVSFNTVPGTSLDTLNIVREIPTKVGGIKPAMDLALITNPTSELIAIGKEKFDVTCASCHGTEGKGDGVAAAALNPKPRNFHQVDGWTNGRTFYDLYKTIQYGVPGTGMAAYEFISPEDRVAIIHYIRTLSDFPEVTSEEVNNKIDSEFHLSAGVVEANNIPIAKSIKLLDDENKTKFEKSVAITEIVLKANDEKAMLLKNNSYNLQKVLYTYLYKLNRKDYRNFVRKLNSDPISIGFKASVVNLDDNDLQQLFSYLKYITSSNDNGRI